MHRRTLCELCPLVLWLAVVTVAQSTSNSSSAAAPARAPFVLPQETTPVSANTIAVPTAQGNWATLDAVADIAFHIPFANVSGAAWQSCVDTLTGYTGDDVCNFDMIRSGGQTLIGQTPQIGHLVLTTPLPQLAGKAAASVTLRLWLSWGYGKMVDPLRSPLPKITVTLADGVAPSATEVEIASWTPSNRAMYDDCHTLACFQMNEITLPTTASVSLATAKYVRLIIDNGQYNLQMAYGYPHRVWITYADQVISSTAAPAVASSTAAPAPVSSTAPAAVSSTAPPHIPFAFSSTGIAPVDANTFAVPMSQSTDYQSASFVSIVHIPGTNWWEKCQDNRPGFGWTGSDVCGFDTVRSGGSNQNGTVVLATPVPRQAGMTVYALSLRLYLTWGYSGWKNFPEIQVALSPSPDGSSATTIATWTPSNVMAYDTCNTLACYQMNDLHVTAAMNVSLDSAKYVKLTFNNLDGNLQFPLVAPNYLWIHYAPAVVVVRQPFSFPTDVPPLPANTVQFSLTAGNMTALPGGLALDFRTLRVGETGNWWQACWDKRTPSYVANDVCGFDSIRSGDNNGKGSLVLNTPLAAQPGKVVSSVSARLYLLWGYGVNTDLNTLPRIDFALADSLTGAGSVVIASWTPNTLAWFDTCNTLACYVNNNITLTTKLNVSLETTKYLRVDITDKANNLQIPVLAPNYIRLTVADGVVPFSWPNDMPAVPADAQSLPINADNITSLNPSAAGFWLNFLTLALGQTDPAWQQCVDTTPTPYLGSDVCGFLGIRTGDRFTTTSAVFSTPLRQQLGMVATAITARLWLSWGYDVNTDSTTLPRIDFALADSVAVDAAYQVIASWTPSNIAWYSTCNTLKCYAKNEVTVRTTFNVSLATTKYVRLIVNNGANNLQIPLSAPNYIFVSSATGQPTAGRGSFSFPTDVPVAPPNSDAVAVGQGNWTSYDKTSFQLDMRTLGVQETQPAWMRCADNSPTSYVGNDVCGFPGIRTGEQNAVTGAVLNQPLMVHAGKVAVAVVARFWLLWGFGISNHDPSTLPRIDFALTDSLDPTASYDVIASWTPSNLAFFGTCNTLACYANNNVTIKTRFNVSLASAKYVRINVINNAYNLQIPYAAPNYLYITYADGLPTPPPPPFSWVVDTPAMPPSTVSLAVGRDNVTSAGDGFWLDFYTLGATDTGDKWRQCVDTRTPSYRGNDVCGFLGARTGDANTRTSALLNQPLPIASGNVAVAVSARLYLLWGYSPNTDNKTLPRIDFALADALDAAASYQVIASWQPNNIAWFGTCNTKPCYANNNVTVRTTFNVSLATTKYLRLIVTNGANNLQIPWSAPNFVWVTYAPGQPTPLPQPFSFPRDTPVLPANTVSLPMNPGNWTALSDGFDIAFTTLGATQSGPAWQQCIDTRSTQYIGKDVCGFVGIRTGNQFTTATGVLNQPLPINSGYIVTSISARLWLSWGYSPNTNPATLPRIDFALADSLDPAANYHIVANWTPSAVSWYGVCNTLACYTSNNVTVSTNFLVSLATPKYLRLIVVNNNNNLQFPYAAPNYLWVTYALGTPTPVPQPFSFPPDTDVVPPFTVAVPVGRGNWTALGTDLSTEFFTPSPGVTSAGYSCATHVPGTAATPDVCNFFGVRSGAPGATGVAVLVKPLPPLTGMVALAISLRLYLSWGYQSAGSGVATLPNISIALTDSLDPAALYQTIATWVPNNIAWYDTCNTAPCYANNNVTVATTFNVSLASPKYVRLSIENKQHNLQMPYGAPNHVWVHYGPGQPTPSNTFEFPPDTTPPANAIDVPLLRTSSSGAGGLDINFLTPQVNLARDWVKCFDHTALPYVAPDVCGFYSMRSGDPNTDGTMLLSSPLATFPGHVAHAVSLRLFLSWGYQSSGNASLPSLDVLLADSAAPAAAATVIATWTPSNLAWWDTCNTRKCYAENNVTVPSVFNVSLATPKYVRLVVHNHNNNLQMVFWAPNHLWILHVPGTPSVVTPTYPVASKLRFTLYFNGTAAEFKANQTSLEARVQAELLALLDFKLYPGTIVYVNLSLGVSLMAVAAPPAGLPVYAVATIAGSSGSTVNSMLSALSASVKQQKVLGGMTVDSTSIVEQPAADASSSTAVNAGLAAGLTIGLVVAVALCAGAYYYYANDRSNAKDHRAGKGRSHKTRGGVGSNALGVGSQGSGSQGLSIELNSTLMGNQQSSAPLPAAGASPYSGGLSMYTSTGLGGGAQVPVAFPVSPTSPTNAATGTGPYVAVPSPTNSARQGALPAVPRL